MKKTLFSVLAAVAGLTLSCCLTGCSDNDGDIDETTEEAAEEAADNEALSTTEYIMEHFVILGDASKSPEQYDDDTESDVTLSTSDDDDASTAQDFVRYGMYGGNVEADHPTTMYYEVKDLAAAQALFQNLVPDAYADQIKASGESRSFSYTENGRQLSLSLTPGTGDNVAVITLPDAAPWNAYVTRLELRDHLTENAGSSLDKVVVGGRYLLTGVVLAARDIGDNADGELRATKTYGKGASDGPVSFLCYAKTNAGARLAYLAGGDLNNRKDENRYFIRYAKLSGQNVERKYSFPYKLNTNTCYADFNSYLPTEDEVEEFCESLKGLIDPYLDYAQEHELFYDSSDFSLFGNAYIICNFFNDNHYTGNYQFATQTKVNNKLGHRKVKYYDVKEGKFAWMNKNHTNELNIIYLVTLLPNGTIVQGTQNRE